MGENPKKFRYDRVAQHASFYKESAKPSRPLVSATSFNLEALTSGVHVSPTSSSRRNISLASPATPSPEANKRNLMLLPLLIVPEGSYDTFLLHLYVDHVASYLWEAKGNIFVL